MSEEGGAGGPGQGLSPSQGHDLAGHVSKELGILLPMPLGPAAPWHQIRALPGDCKKMLWGNLHVPSPASELGTPETPIPVCAWHPEML